METFEITVELKSPVVLGTDTFWTLDGVCFGILDDMRKVGLTDLNPVDSIPLKCEDGLFYASRAFFDNDVRQDKAKIGGIRPVKDMQEATSFISSPRGRMPKVVTTRFPFKSHLSRYVEIGARSVSWIAVGNPDAVAALIVNAGSVGALRKDGHGKVGEVHVVVDASLDPLITDGMPLRPIPETHAAAKVFDPELPKIEDAWRPSYFDISNRAVCFVPAR
ncbi:hypothetical protein OIU34_20610 [Pararhizobium sp. BT-229]|uniref:hypothetical protein n=1 Tax=Pararhizobium sp. BT-229 TaxID=2986923 RepID=UPI0021F74A36|nr:hypothetical protein [Pararhizobium sp. BT-229]MCV9964292.1 hypothetical protein [Pararhizobium sp. BT-229]